MQVSWKTILACLALIFALGGGASAVAQEAFSVERYAALQSAMEDADIARAEAAPDTPEREAATEVAMAARRELLRYVSDWLASGDMSPELVENARAARLVLVENIIQLNLDLSRCDEAAGFLTLIDEFRRSEDQDFQRAYTAAQEGINRCREAADSADQTAEAIDEADSSEADSSEADSGEVVSGSIGERDTSGREGEEEQTTGEDGTTLVPLELQEPRDQMVGWSLVAAGGALLGAGSAWNVALLGIRTSYLEDRDACEGSGEASSRVCADAEAGRETLADAKLPIGVLMGGGSVLLGVGAVLLLWPEPEVVSGGPVSLNVTPGYVGVRLDLLSLGGL